MIFRAMSDAGGQSPSSDCSEPLKPTACKNAGREGAGGQARVAAGDKTGQGGEEGGGSGGGAGDGVRVVVRVRPLYPSEERERDMVKVMADGQTLALQSDDSAAGEDYAAESLQQQQQQQHMQSFTFQRV